MAHEQNPDGSLSRAESNKNAVPDQKNKPVPTLPDNANGCFDCNICLDSAHEPVVTLCGHLYCWPCIYKWHHVQSYSDEVDNEPKCPVCKSKISLSALVPLYGRGASPSESNSKRPQFDVMIPRRPSPHGIHTLITSAASLPPHQTPQNLANPYGNFASAIGPSNFGGGGMTSAISPSVGMFGEMVYARMFGGSETAVFPYPHLSSNPILGNGAPRIRRQEMQLDKSLNRVSIFLFCCFILCLLLF